MERSQPVQNAAYEFLGVLGGKMPSVFLYSVQQVAPRKQLQNHIDRVFGLKHSFQLEEVLVSVLLSLSQFPHHSYLIDEALPTVHSLPECCLRKGLNCKVTVVCEALHLID